LKLKFCSFPPALPKKGSERIILQHRGKRSRIKLIKQYSFGNSKFDAKLQETIFVGTQEKLKDYLQKTLPTADLGALDFPQGTILSDNRGCGVFQQNVFL